MIIYKIHSMEGEDQQGPYLASAMWASRPEADVLGVNTGDRERVRRRKNAKRT
jgi:hypothetical protein